MLNGTDVQAHGSEGWHPEDKRVIPPTPTALNQQNSVLSTTARWARLLALRDIQHQGKRRQLPCDSVDITVVWARSGT